MDIESAITLVEYLKENDRNETAEHLVSITVRLDCLETALKEIMEDVEECLSILGTLEKEQ